MLRSFIDFRFDNVREMNWRVVCMISYFQRKSISFLNKIVWSLSWGEESPHPPLFRQRRRDTSVWTTHTSLSIY